MEKIPTINSIKMGFGFMRILILKFFHQEQKHQITMILIGTHLPLPENVTEEKMNVFHLTS